MTETGPTPAHAAPPDAAASVPGTPAGGDIFNDPVFLKNLKIAVVVMALILIFGFIAIIARIFYLSSRTPAKPAVEATTATAPGLPSAAAALAPNPRLDLPKDAVVRAVSLSGNRIAVQFEAPSGSGIAILDLESGRTLSRIGIGAESGGK